MTETIEKRIKTLSSVLNNKKDKDAVEKTFLASKGDWTTASTDLKDKLSEEILQKVSFAHSLADWSNDHLGIVKTLAEQPELNNMRKVALRYNPEKLAALVDLKDVSETTPGTTEDEKKKNFAVALHQKLFNIEPSAVLQRMVNEGEIHIANAAISTGVANVLNNLPDFNIRTTSVYKAFKQPDAFKGIVEEYREDVKQKLKHLSLLTAVSPVPEAVPFLMKANLTSAYHIGEMPESTFLRKYGSELGEDIARQVYTNAINSRIRNERALITLRETVRGTGIAIIDGQRSIGERLNVAQGVADEYGAEINLETLFGSMDFCECEECNSVYSPAAYFVELLQFLRNNDLGPIPNSSGKPEDNPNIKSGYEDTPLEMLFRRRPDLGELELTCQNTNTVLPYIDLVNEVMESFVVHLDEYSAEDIKIHNPRQVQLDVFNVVDEPSSELLAQPQNINYKAYCTLKKEVFPLTLPYHQPIDAIRIFLNYLGTSRYELLKRFKTAHEDCGDFSASDKDDLNKIHKTVLQRAADAEFLGLTQEEYIILTKEAFWPKRYFDITLKKSCTEEEYCQNIGVKPVFKYYGYDSEPTMLNTDEDNQLGLTFVKKQFLPRTGIQYVDLVELLKTRFINPYYPQGKSLTILENIRSNYRYLQTLVVPNTIDKKKRFAKLIDFLENTLPSLLQSEARSNSNPYQEQKNDYFIKCQDLRQWVYCNFDNIGKLIVLESGEGLSHLPIEGEIFAPYPEEGPQLRAEISIVNSDVDGIHVGTLYENGTIVDIKKEVIGHLVPTKGTYDPINNTFVSEDGTVTNDVGSGSITGLTDKKIVTATGITWVGVNPFPQQSGNDDYELEIRKEGSNQPIRGFIYHNVLWQKGSDDNEDDYERGVFLWQSAKDTCNLDKVRLTHLNGKAVNKDEDISKIFNEYDRMHRFIRLWCKMGWTIDEMGNALIGLSVSKKETDTQPAKNNNCHHINFDTFKEDCDCSQERDNNSSDIDCPNALFQICDITPDTLHQLVAIQKLLDLTGLPLEKLLTFWADISTSGEKSLYSRLFLTHNLVAIDKVFKADENDNYLTQPAKLTDHIPVLMAALKLKADDITAIMQLYDLKDNLTLSNVSSLYRHALLSKILHVKVTDLKDIFSLFGNPFDNAHETLQMLKTWGKMEDAGFTFRQMNYLIQNNDDALRPLAPSKKTVLTISKTIYDGLNAIYKDNEDIPEDKQDEVTADVVRAKAGLIFERDVVEKIIGLLEGTTVYTTNAPANQDIKIPPPLTKKLKYNNLKDTNPPSATIQVTGILTATEKSEAITLCKDAGWQKAIERVEKQAKNIFSDALFSIFTDLEEAKEKLLIGDILPPDGDTALEKRLYFLQIFLPFLRQRLTRRFLVDTLSGFSGMSREVTEVLLSDILVVGSDSQSAISALENIKQTTVESTNDWKGYLIPPADGSYTFIATFEETQPKATLSINGTEFVFKYQQEDPSNVWSTDPTELLKGGTLYEIELKNLPANQLMWKASGSSKMVISTSAIPASALLPDHLAKGTDEVFTKLCKVSLLVNGFSLNPEEMSYLKWNAADFDAINFNAITLKHWQRLQAYASLRDSLPKLDKTLLDLFKWAGQPDDPKKLSEQIFAATGWKKEIVEKLLTPDHFDLSPKDFCNEMNLVKLKKSLAVADKIGMDINKLFEWANPGSKFWECHKIAEDIRYAARSRFTQEDWEQAVKPLNNKLRENQKQALISYLLVRKELRDCGVVDADSLFEFFLIDVQMCPCMETSRIKQAISSVQLFIQRCLLGLEENYGILKDTNNQVIPSSTMQGVQSNAIDRKRWESIQKYRVREANLKVFLYPENWIVSELRDDKSPFYKELESELLQKDINTQTVEDALKSYLFKVEEVSNLKVVGLFEEQDLDMNGVPVIKDENPVYVKLHVFARTRNAPYLFYYRYFDVTESNWYPWEKVQVDIPSYDVENANGQIVNNGTYLIPVVWNKRLLIFFPQFMKKTIAQDSGNSSLSVPAKPDKSGEVTMHKPFDFWEIKIAWSEYRNRKWTQKQISTEAIYTPVGDYLFCWDDLGNLVFLKSFIESKIPISLDEVNFQKNSSGNEITANVDVREIKLTLNDNKMKVDLLITEPNKNKNLPNTILVTEELVASSENSKLNIYSYASIRHEQGTNWVNEYRFIPRIVTTLPDLPTQVVVDVYKHKPAIGAFHFYGSQISKGPALADENSKDTTNFHYNFNRIHSFQAFDDKDSLLVDKSPYFDDSNNEICVAVNKTDEIKFPFIHPFAHDLLGKLMADNLDDLFAYYKIVTNTDGAKEDAFGADPDINIIWNELRRSYSLYNWEAAFHAPMLLVDRLLKSQQFDQALKMCHYVFNPLAENTGAKDTKYVWQFPPFKIDARNVLEQLFLNLQPNAPNDKINEWRNKCFQPHVIARSRPSAYMKWVVMKYIEILIAYGDYYFRQNTLETIPMAVQCYVLAAHIYGRPGQKIPKRGKIKPQTYNSLLDKWDAFGNAMVEMELAFPYSNQSSLPIGISNGVAGLPNIFGFSTSLYFCIPDNPNLRNLKDTIDDRLFKIRHCEDIEGVFRKLPLFEPPIDPALLVQAVAQGLSLSSVLNDLNSPMPNYRFYYLLQKALELCSELKALGNAFLSAKEKGEAEALSILRAKHESSIHNLVMEVRKQQLEEAQRSLEALQQSRKGPEYRMQCYIKQIGEDLSKIPDSNTDFSELPNNIEQPIDESGLKLNSFEKEEMDKASESKEKQTTVGIIETTASGLHALPNFTFNTQPWGVGLSTSLGGSNLGSAAQGFARAIQIGASSLSSESASAGRKGGFLRQLQERIQQANIAGYEIKNIDKQILTQQIRISIAQQEITNQQKQIDNAQEVEEYLRNKYTNQELYSWMEGSIRTLYYQAYTLAYDLAKRTEKVYCFERGLTTSNFIQFGYWDASHDGLLAGERLYIGLKQLEAAYQEKRGYDYEITKHVSLRQLNPLALLELKENGTCEFALPEILFDMDHPGHYMRRIKSVALTVPCVVGPYTSLNCTLRLLEHKFRIKAIAKDKGDYPEKTEEEDERFSTVNVPITSIAISTGQNDSGVFELNFRDERYIPFEGAGAISKWRIELPTEFRQFDYDTISDVILHVRYTTIEGGDKLKAAATGSVHEYIKNVEELSLQQGLFAAFDIKHEFPDEWYKAVCLPADAERLIKLNNLNERLPFFTKGRKVNATDIYLVSSANIGTVKLILTPGSDELDFTVGPLEGESIHSFAIHEVESPINSWQLQINDVKPELDKLWLIVRYKM